MRIEHVAAISEETLATIRAGMRQHAETHVPWEEYEELSFVARTQDGSVVGAALGESGRGWLHVSVIWVDERFRRQRIGSKLLDAIEAEARRRGCHDAYLDTFSYQARPFYEAQGYEVFGSLNDYPIGHQRFFMRKSLSQPCDGVPAAWALTPDECELARLLQFDQDICLLVKEHASSELERLIGIDEAGEQKPADGLSVAVKDGDEAERVMDAIRPLLEPKGYRAFWSARQEPNGMHQGYEVAILKTTDPFAMIRLRRTDGGNYGISTVDIIDRLTAWQQIATFDVVGASTDWVALVFSKLPEKICAFAEEVFDFCPDSVDQSFGLLRERDHPEKFDAARRLCPEVSERIANYDQTSLAKLRAFHPEFAAGAMKLRQSGNSTSTDMGVRLLAHQLKTTRFLWLWWD